MAKKNVNDIMISHFSEVDIEEANYFLEKWEHKMGPLNRRYHKAICHMLYFQNEPVAVTTTSNLIREHVGGGLIDLTRDNTIELSRLCASRPDLCRIVLRMWREFVFPYLPYEIAISYQDSEIHNGNTYRFDGWKKAAFSHSGIDRRSGREGRDKWIWVWPSNFEQILLKNQINNS